MDILTVYSRGKLACAMATDFDKQVTGFLVGARFEACCCIGVIYNYASAPADGGFRDGRRIRTSDVLRVEKNNGLWIFETHTGSRYVIVTFEHRVGWASLGVFRKILAKGYHVTARRLQ